jgi:hypothetical protein
MIEKKSSLRRKFKRFIRKLGKEGNRSLGRQMRLKIL